MKSGNVIEHVKVELLPCPFCGGEASVRNDHGKFAIVGCNAITMLCPNPSITVYRGDNGEFDFAYWNTRLICKKAEKGI
jgi:hypothetical protein